MSTTHVLKGSIISLFIVAAFAVFVPSAHADSWTVDTGSSTSTCAAVTDTTCNSLQSAADAATAGDTITLASDITTSAQVTLTKSLTIDGGNHTLTADFAKTSNSNNAAIGIQSTDVVTLKNLTINKGSSGSNLHGINTYLATNVALQDITVSGFNAALIVNGSSVTADNFNTSGNSWGSVDVDPGSGVSDPSVFTLNSGTLGDGTQIWSDGSNVTSSATVTVNASGYTQYHVAGTTAFYLWTNGSPEGVTISSDPTTLYSTVQAAIDAATSGDTVSLQSNATTTSQINITKAITLEGNGHTIFPNFTKTDNSNNSAILVNGADVTIQNLTIDGTSGTNLHGINTYALANVTLSGVTVTNNDHAALIVNGSSVTATNFNTSGNTWGSVDVDPGSGVTDPSVFTLNSGTLSESTQIWSDGSNVTAGSPVVTVVASGYTKYLLAGTDDFYVWSNSTPKGATIGGDASNTLYSTIQTALSAASSGQTVNVGAGTYTETLTIATPVTLQGHSASDTIINGQITVNADNVAVKDFTVSNPSGSIGILLKGDSPDVEGNIVTDVGTSLSSGSAQGIYLDYSSADLTGATISNNTISNIGNTSLVKDSSGSSSKGIFVGDSNFTHTLNGLVINNNGISSISNSTAAFGSGGRGAYGILINYGAATTSASVSSATITNNHIAGLEGCWAHGIGLETNTPNAVVTGNVINHLTGSSCNDAAAVFFEDNPSSTSVQVNHNSFDTSTVTYGVALASAMTTGADATLNYWNNGGGDPTLKTATSSLGQVNVSPWYTDEAMTTLGNQLTDAGGGSFTAMTGTSNTSLSGSSTQGGSVTVSATIPSGTTITGNSSWNGTVTPPTATTTTVTISGFTTTVSSAIAIGSSDSDLTFDKAVQLTFSGQTGQLIGWYNHAGTFTEITDVCADNTQATNDTNLAAGGSCKFDTGTDMVVWTKHFSTFVTYTSTAVSSGGGGSTTTTTTTTGGNGPVASGGGGGGGGGAVAVALPNNGGAAPGTTGTGTTGTGQVLGAAVYNFATNLTIGSTGTDVTELQKVLIAEGDLSIEAPTGYFGPLTKAAVIKYQAAHDITPQSGFVGPLTRAELNKGTTPTSADEQKALLIQSLQQQLQVLLQKIQELTAGTSSAQ